MKSLRGSQPQSPHHSATTAVVSCSVHYDSLSERCSRMWSAIVITVVLLWSVVVSTVKVCHSGCLVAIDVASHCGHCHGHSCGQLKGFRAQHHCFAWASSP